MGYGVHDGLVSVFMSSWDGGVSFYDMVVARNIVPGSTAQRLNPCSSHLGPCGDEQTDVA